MPCSLDDLIGSRGRIDFVLLSHNHFDHLDLRAVRLFSKETRWVVPPGVKKQLADNGVLEDLISEVKWWEEGRFDVEVMTRKDQDEKRIHSQRRVRFHAVPAMHWTGRSLTDVNTTLWNSYVVRVECQRKERGSYVYTLEKQGSHVYHPNSSSKKIRELDLWHKWCATSKGLYCH